MSRTGPSREVAPEPARRCDPWSFLLVTLVGADVHPRLVPVVRAARLLLRLPTTSLPPCRSCSTDTTRTFPPVAPSWSLPSPPANAGAPGDPRTSSAASVAAAGSARRSSTVSPLVKQVQSGRSAADRDSMAGRDRGNSVRSRRGTPLPHRSRRPATGAPRSGTLARPWPSAPTRSRHPEPRSAQRHVAGQRRRVSHGWRRWWGWWPSPGSLLRPGRRRQPRLSADEDIEDADRARGRPPPAFPLVGAFCAAPPTGLEPVTLRLTVECSAN